MIDITKLADKWRKDAEWTNSPLPPQFENEIYAEAKELMRIECAKELTAALPTWTEITEDVARDVSRRNQKWIVWSKDYDIEILDGAVFLARLGGYCRPLCSLDRPPERES